MIGNQIASAVNMPPSNLSENYIAINIPNETAANKNILSAASSSSHSITNIETSELESQEFEPTQPKKAKFENKNKSEGSPTKERKIIYNMHNCTIQIN